MQARTLIVVILGLALVVGTVVAQDDVAEFGLAYSSAQQKNIDQIKQYRWKTSTVVTQGGEVKRTRVVSNRLSEKGEMVQTVDEDEKSGRDKKGLRGKRQDNKAEDKEDYFVEIVAKMSAYVFMTKGQEVDFFDKGSVSDGSGDLQGTRMIRASDVLATGDGLTKWVDPETLQTKRIDVFFLVDETTVKGEVLYRPIEGGPNVPRMCTIRVLEKEIVVEAEFMEYTKQL